MWCGLVLPPFPYSLLYPYQAQTLLILYCTQMNLARRTAMLECQCVYVYNGIRAQGVNGKGIKIKDLDRGKI